MNEIHQGNIGLIEWRRLGSLGSMGPLVRPINRHNRHCKAILGIPEQRRIIPWHRGGPAAPRGSAAPPNCRVGRNRPRHRPLTASGAVTRGIQGKRWWVTRLAAPLDPSAPVILGPRAQPTSLAYKRHLTLTGLDTQRRSISISLFCSLRVGLVYLGS
jgi:hypothetical protein